MSISVATFERPHALLSASGSERWLACPPSARLEQEFPEENSPYAAEGTLAHKLAEIFLANHLGHLSSKDFYVSLDELKTSPLYTEEMLDHVLTYQTLAIERINEAHAATGDEIVLLEQKLDFSPWVPDGFGTGDLVIIADNVLEIIDLKYGKGVAVSAEENTQLRLYALGAINLFSHLYDFDKVRMTICQPRLDSTSTMEVFVENLLAWGEEIVKPQAELGYQGAGEFYAGNHCRFCRARAVCRTRAETNLTLAKYEFLPPTALGVDEIADVLTRGLELQSWVSDVQAYALNQAENQGIRFPGWKLVEGRSNRKYTDEDTVAQTLLQAGYDETAIFEKVLLTITAMEKKLGKKRFGELLNGLVIKPPGKATLVPESDKRPEISSVASAIADFQ